MTDREQAKFDRVTQALESQNEQLTVACKILKAQNKDLKLRLSETYTDRWGNVWNLVSSPPAKDTE